MSVAASHGLEALKPAAHGSWEPRRVLTLSAARRRTALVRGLRIGFIVAAIAIVLTVIIQMITGSLQPAPGAPEAVGTDVRMINPRFSGRDENLTPYVLTADSAIRRRESANGLTDLNRPRLVYDFLSENEGGSNVLAQTGTYDPAERVLDLETDVNFSTFTGYRFETSHARIFLREERALGDQPVTGNGPMGQIRADRFEIRESGDHVIFEGRVSARIVQDRTRPDARPGEE